MEDEEEKEAKKTKTILESKYAIIVLIIVLIAVFAILFIKLEEQKEHPLIIFKEDPDEEGTYIGVVQEDTEHNISDLSITIFDVSRGESGSLDPIVPERTLIIYISIPYDGLNFTFYDVNHNDIFDKGDELIFKNVEERDLYKMIQKNGKLFH